MPRSWGLMRPSAVTADASVNTSAAPPTARLPRWTRCQSFAKPSTDEYWHMGDTRMRFARLRERRGRDSKRWGMEGGYLSYRPAFDFASPDVIFAKPSLNSRIQRLGTEKPWPTLWSQTS